MTDAIAAVIHPSRFPDADREQLLQSLAQRRIAMRFHYESHAQAHLWLQVHNTFAPSRTDTHYPAHIERLHGAALSCGNHQPSFVIGLGCGSGQKEAQLLRLFAARNLVAGYVPVDTSLPLLIMATHAAREVLPALNARPVVADLSELHALSPLLDQLADPSHPRVFTFFGMLPNLEPAQAFRQFQALLRPQDLLIASANLAPGTDDTRGMQRILPQYDNPPTREWLQRLMLDLGAERSDGSIQFGIQDTAAPGIRQVVADYIFDRPRQLTAQGRAFDFQPGDKVRLFFSCRYTPERIAATASSAGLAIVAHEVLASGEEMIFLCRPANAQPT